MAPADFSSTVRGRRPKAGMVVMLLRAKERVPRKHCRLRTFFGLHEFDRRPTCTTWAYARRKKLPGLCVPFRLTSHESADVVGVARKSSTGSAYMNTAVSRSCFAVVASRGGCAWESGIGAFWRLCRFWNETCCAVRGDSAMTDLRQQFNGQHWCEEYSGSARQGVIAALASRCRLTAKATKANCSCEYRYTRTVRTCLRRVSGIDTDGVLWHKPAVHQPKSYNR